MNNKGEINVGMLLSIFAGVIVALALYTSTIGYYGTTSTTYTITNKTFTTTAAGTYVDLTGQELITVPTLVNATGGVPSATNYSIAEGVSTVDGLKRIRMQIIGSEVASQAVNVSYTYGPEGYIADSSSRSVAGLIAIFAALGIGIFVLYPVLREKFDI